ncbi:hypothetical protein FIV00_26215 [Labrenzia sp. THAF82]|nr:hypothetical protein FIV00_26215 [Labrenzia sp. THAF82]
MKPSARHRHLHICAKPAFKCAVHVLYRHCGRCCDVPFGTGTSRMRKPSNEIATLAETVVPTNKIRHWLQVKETGLAGLGWKPPHSMTVAGRKDQ